MFPSVGWSRFTNMRTIHLQFLYFRLSYCHCHWAVNKSAALSRSFDGIYPPSLPTDIRWNCFANLERKKICKQKVIFSKYGCYLVAMIRNGMSLLFCFDFMSCDNFFSLHYRSPSSTMQAKLCLHIFEKSAIIFLQEKS